ncbi:MAG: 50S ribosomal protein L5 [Rickettsiaceae bacterium H1]|nr:50S ribosomal protein L5 [Rickettsiaceae bacterium H1]
MLQNLYNNEIVKKISQFIGCSNVMEVPRLLKVCVNVGISSKNNDAKLVDTVVKDLAFITGQKPVVTKAKKSISGFSIRKGDSIGCKVTLRKSFMYNFLERLLYIALPREKDFQGFTINQFDGNGNMSFGIKEHVVFPEINYENVSNPFGMDINIVTSASIDDHAKILLSFLGFPFRTIGV